MSYTKQGFKSGEKLYASQLNSMDEQIYKNSKQIQLNEFVLSMNEDATFNVGEDIDVGDFIRFTTPCVDGVPATRHILYESVSNGEELTSTLPFPEFHGENMPLISELEFEVTDDVRSVSVGNNVISYIKADIQLRQLKSKSSRLQEEKVDKPSTATVGQMIIVKTVDENGKPTEFEAVNVPSNDSNDVDLSNLGMKFEGTTLTLENNGESLDSVELPTIPTPVTNPRTNCVLTVGGTGKGGFLIAGVVVQNPNLSNTIDLDIDFEVLEGTTTYIQPWIYDYGMQSSTNQSKGSLLAQLANKNYSSGKTNYTFTQTDDKFAAEKLILLFKIPDTVTKYQITFNSIGVFNIERTIKSYVYCGDLDTLKLTYEQEYSSLRILSRWSGKRYLALGDSLTDAGFNSPDYPSLIKDVLGFSVVDNLGKSGMTMSTANSSNNLTSRKKMISYDYDIITIMLGINDYTFNTCALGDVDSNEYDVSTFVGAYRDVLDYIIDNNPKALIVLIQPIFYGKETSANTQGNTLNEFREAVKQLAEMYNLPTVNLRTGFNSRNADNFYKEVYPTSLHLNEEGQKRMADILSQFLATV